MHFFISEILNPQNYFFSAYMLFHVIACVIMTVLAIIFIKRENFSNTSLIFVFMVAMIVMWLSGDAAMFSSDKEQVLLWWARIQNLGVVFLMPGMFLLTLAVINKLNHYKLISILCFTVSFILAFIIIRTDSFFTGFYHYPWGYYCRYFSIPSSLFLIFFFCVAIFMISLFILGRRSVLSEKLKKRYLYILVLCLFSFLAGFDFTIAFGMNKNPPIGGLTTFISVCCAFVFLNRYELTEFSPRFTASNIIKTMNDVLILLNKDGIIQFVNSSAKDFFNMSDNELKGKHLLQIIDDPEFSKNFDLIMKTGSLDDYEISCMKDERDKRSLSLSFLSIRNKLRQTLAIVCIARDRTEDKKVEYDLERAYEVPIKIVNGIPAGIIVTDKNRKVRQINKAALKLFQLTQEKEILNKIYTVKQVEGKGKTNVTSPLEECQAREEVIISPAGMEIVVLRTSLSVKIDNEALYLSVLVNINERKALEEQLKVQKVYLEKLVKERANELENVNSQLVDEAAERKRIEGELRSSIDDLEKFKRITKDRNNKLIELKKQANMLALELGKPEIYKI